METVTEVAKTEVVLSDEQKAQIARAAQINELAAVIGKMLSDANCELTVEHNVRVVSKNR